MPSIQHRPSREPSGRRRAFKRGIMLAGVLGALLTAAGAFNPTGALANSYTGMLNAGELHIQLPALQPAWAPDRFTRKTHGALPQVRSSPASPTRPARSRRRSRM